MVKALPGRRLWRRPAGPRAPAASPARVNVRVLLHGFPQKERSVDVPSGASVADLLKALGIRRDLVVVFRADRPVPDSDTVADGETLRVLRIVSGG